jgi:lipase ATG15
MISVFIGLVICLLLTRSYGLEFKTHNITVYRPRDILAVEEARRSSFSLRQCVSIEWEERMVSAPDVHDKSTLIQLARMSGNAYALPGQDNWYDLDPVWFRVRPT